MLHFKFSLSSATQQYQDIIEFLTALHVSAYAAIIKCVMIPGTAVTSAPLRTAFVFTVINGAIVVLFILIISFISLFIILFIPPVPNSYEHRFLTASVV
jgi:hypothetical protein